MKVLVAEDDVNIREGLARVLRDEGYDVVLAPDGAEAMRLYAQESPDFVCLDIMMPGKSGYDVCREIRRRDAGVPIVFISAKSEEIDKVVGLELGGDDFIMKPFGIKEVVARIRAVTRRCLAARGAAPSTTAAPAATPAAATAAAAAPPRQREFRMADLTVLPLELRARRDETTVDLSLRDVKILELLWRRKGEVVSRDDLYTGCWGIDHVPESRTVDQHISQLRKRIECDPARPRIIRTVHGAGYRYEE